LSCWSVKLKKKSIKKNKKKLTESTQINLSSSQLGSLDRDNPKK
jgi:hypothetical protein